MQQLKDVMTQNVKILSPDATIKDAARQMRDGDFGLMPVGENDRLVGTLSDRDIVVRAVADGRDANTKVRDLMSTDVKWAFEDDSVEQAHQIMSDNQIRRLPIVNAEKRLVSIVALGDLAVDGTDTQAAGEALSEISKPG
ncbi:inosine-5-monophosphate dehydrogenase [Pollutimonas nitritireducens]|uniref:Inosine-5-monophosphate dehydrogenase n=1 Tax=Pollutimonas nitritireducens TaxID=2045209 RepID=A0A2N4UG43_9BURK|nr:CBS domain-containing protein [Pollutimonas nitritireducens]PLC53993.1 inosine-5-monophosphate dehydrogenase [Pollutimonas nitritireducens]